MRLNRLIAIAMLATALLASCGGADDYTPKPQAYLRIDLPPHVYTVYDTAAPTTISAPCITKWENTPRRWNTSESRGQEL